MCALITPSIVASTVSPVRPFTNHMSVVDGVEQSWFIDSSKNDAGEQTSDSVRRDKRIPSTIHNFKGRERDAIIFVEEQGEGTFASVVVLYFRHRIAT